MWYPLQPTGAGRQLSWGAFSSAAGRAWGCSVILAASSWPFSPLRFVTKQLSRREGMLRGIMWRQKTTLYGDKDVIFLFGHDNWLIFGLGGKCLVFTEFKRIFRLTLLRNVLTQRWLAAVERGDSPPIFSTLHFGRWGVRKLQVCELHSSCCLFVYIKGYWKTDMYVGFVLMSIWLSSYNKSGMSHMAIHSYCLILHRKIICHPRLESYRQSSKFYLNQATCAFLTLKCIN